jgi:hypothetical protein
MPDFEGCRNNAKNEFEENQNYVGGKFYQEPDHLYEYGQGKNSDNVSCK